MIDQVITEPSAAVGRLLGAAGVDDPTRHECLPPDAFGIEHPGLVLVRRIVGGSSNRRVENSTGASRSPVLSPMWIPLR